MKILKMCLKVVLSEITKKKAICKLSMALTVHEIMKKRTKYAKTALTALVTQ
jgi:hypothetical protein